MLKRLRNYATVFADEVGLSHLLKSPLDTKILLFQRLIRFLAYGSTTLVLVLMLRALDIDETKIGLFMTLTLFGDVVISLVLTLIADGLGRRRMLALGAVLVMGSGVVFALSSNYWVLLVAAVLGVISPSGGEIGPFRAIEESVLSSLTTSEDRTGIFAWYAIFGYAGTSVGVLICGWAMRVVQTKSHWQPIDSYRLVFWAYAALGFVYLLLCLVLTEKCESERTPEVDKSNDETRPLLANGADATEGHPNGTTQPETAPDRPSASVFDKLLPKISRSSVSIVWKLCLLFAMDSAASGLSQASWVIYWFNERFGLSEGKLGTLFFVANILSTFSNFAAAPLARRIGLIKTMVFTHVPASIALALIPLPNNVGIAIALLIFRYSVNSMDQAPRQAFIAAAVLPSERTAVMGTVNVVKTLSQSIGPVVTGVLAERHLFWISFLLAGGLKLAYDFLMLAMFLGYRTVEERAEQVLEISSDAEEDNTTRTR